MMGWFRRHRRRDYVSEEWLRSRDRLESRIEFQGVNWIWPINKIRNESALRISRRRGASIQKGSAA